jgi:S-adenosylmethionine uptake transporter
MALSVKTAMPILFGIVGAALLSMMAGLVKAVSPTASRPQLLFIVFALMAVTVLLLLALKRQPLPTRTELKNQILPAALLLATGACLVAAVARLPLTLVIGLFCVTPLIVAAIEIVAGWRRFDPVTGPALAAGLLGAVIIASTVETLVPQLIAAVVAPLVAAIGTVFVDAAQGPPRHATRLVFARLAMAAIATLPLISLGTWQTPDAVNTFAFVLIGIFGIGGYFSLMAAATRLSAGQVALIQQTAWLWAALIGLITFGEVQFWAYWLGAILVVGGAVMVARPPTAIPA